MFTVCPKCALTLVVTAADLRVAQGYVRCGRCSNVFNALARLSEDRQAGGPAAQAQSPPQPAPVSKPSTSSMTFRTRQLEDPAPTWKMDTSASARLRQRSEPPDAHNGSDASDSDQRRVADFPATSTRPTDSSATSTQRKAAEQRPAVPSPPPGEPKRYDDNTILEEDLEFNPESTDVTKVFVEQAPSPQFTAATGTFKALRLEAEEAARREDKPGDQSGADAPFDPVNTQVDVEIDPDLLETMAQLTSNRLARLDPTSPPPSAEPTPAAPPASSATAGDRKVIPFSSDSQVPASQAAAAIPDPQTKAAIAAPASGPGEQAIPAEPQQVRPVSTSMRLAQRAKARAEAAQTASFETAQAIRAALLPRRRTATAIGPEGAAPTPFQTFPGAWTAGSIMLLLLLAAQVIHHYRNDLAATSSLNGPLTSLYAVLGIPLIPRWDLGAYEVRQLGASTAAEAPGQITVRASVKNAAHQAQPLPLLRVTLQDRFGNRIASRDVPPQSYLPRAIPRSTLLSAGQRIDAEMAFVDPGSNAVGFEIDACLPAPGGGIACANDAAR
jgi:predicted Zn finger-like uncharacterized protein